MKKRDRLLAIAVSASRVRRNQAAYHPGANHGFGGDPGTQAKEGSGMKADKVMRSELGR
jgi:hypothetical protein